ncbi:origin recognition complex family member protein [Theileria equi strain WA]|uniref:Origin recognition complex subunit 2 n=1 Tax=Theileria equi strain WA TaxID=1537102 RepID=L0AYB8_THEEQ|nr:origin recognition complex family member protein [Theileria equi strain WA]AFZ80582.1 origin recognition complex family member protein [Theileria equi strain WA]|eukprot:XP_004830248.1 origin recognition complex family member protein [Theileria equi strain WA]
MTNHNVFIPVPSDLEKLIKANKTQALQKIVLYPYNEQKFTIKYDDKEVAEDEHLYKNIAKNFSWLSGQLKNERLRYKRKIGNIPGIESSYLFDTSSPHLDTDTDSDDGISSDEEWKTRKDNRHNDSFLLSIASRCKKVNEKKGLESSDDETGDLMCESVQRQTEEKLSDTTASVIEDMENSNNIDQALLYDYFKPRSIKHIKITDIEKMMIQSEKENLFDCKLDNVLLKALEKSSFLDYLQLVSRVSKKSKTVPRSFFKSVIQWKTWIENRYNLCFYGVGSSRNILKLVAKFVLRDGHCLMINAYKNKGSDSFLFWNFLKRHVCVSKSKMKRSQIIKEVVQKIKQRQTPFYLLIDGLDEFILNNGFEDIKPLIRMKEVLVIGSIGHLKNGSILYILNKYLMNYKFIYCDSGVDYRSELVSFWEKNPPKFIVNHEIQKSATEVQSVIEALSHNHRKLFSLVVQIQSEMMNNETKFIGIEKTSILRDPRAITICHNENKLDSLLTEFITHDVIEQTRGASGKLYLRIPFSLYVSLLSFNTISHRHTLENFTF